MRHILMILVTVRMVARKVFPENCEASHHGRLFFKVSSAASIRSSWILVHADFLLQCNDGGAPSAPQHFLNFLPLPQGQGSLRPIFGPPRTIGAIAF